MEELTGKGVVVEFHKEKLRFTGDDSSIQKMMFQIIGAVAEFGRALIKERQREGIKNALKKGVKFGAQAKLTGEQVEDIRQRANAGEQKKALAVEYGGSRQTLYTALSRS